MVMQCELTHHEIDVECLHGVLIEVCGSDSSGGVVLVEFADEEVEVE